MSIEGDLAAQSFSFPATRGAPLEKESIIYNSGFL